MYPLVADGFYGREIESVREKGLAFVTPIDCKRDLQAVHGRTLYAQVGVAPAMVVVAVDIAVGNVHASYVAYFAVDDNNLAVVAVVDA